MILQQLKEIEKSNNIKILFACESGSRAWKFPSQDSDYDVRFIYIHPPDYYLSIDPVGIGHKRDVIELPINNMLDITGWELTKTLRLFRKSNPALLEWLSSEIIYYQAFSTINKMQQLTSIFFTPLSCIYHYLHMANNNYRDYLKGDNVKIKKYFYVIRPVLAARWIEQFNEFPPLAFQTLVDKVMPEGPVKQEILLLLKRKIAGDELNLEPRIDMINEFLEKELIRLHAYAATLKKDTYNPTNQLNHLFRETLHEVWNY